MSGIVKILVGLTIIAVAILFAPFSAGFSLALIQVGASLVIAGFVQLITPKTKIDGGKVTARIAEPTRWNNGGITRQGGAVMFGDFDDDGNLWYLLVHCDSILIDTVQVYFDDEAVEFDGSGNCITDAFCLTGKKKPYEGSGTRVTYIQMWTTTFTEGDPTPPAIAALASAFPTKWTSDHKLVGTTYSVIKIKPLKVEDRYKIYRWRGALGLGEPSVSLAGKWSNMYDPRDVAQTLGDRTTYAFSRNSVIVWAWFRTLRYGRNKSESSINWDRIAEQADICDQTVTGISGDHVRYRCDIAVPDDMERVTAEQQILLSMDGQLVFDDDGKCWVRAGYYETPSLALTRNRDIVAMESIEAQNGESETQGVIVRYTDPDAKYIAQPAAAWLNPLYYVEGVPATFLTIDILSCTDHNQAMRLAKGIGMRSQPLHKLAPVVGLRGLKARQERIINLNYDNIFAGDYEIYTPVEIDENGYFCTFACVPVDGDRWVLLPGEERAKPVIDYSSGTATIPLPTTVVIAYNNSQITATFDPPVRDDYIVQFQYIATVDLASDNWIEMAVDQDQYIAHSGTVNENVEYKMQWRTVAASGRVSAWYAPPYTVSPLITPMPPPTAGTATGGLGFADLTGRNPADIRFNFARVYRNTVNVFGTATAIIDLDGPPSGTINYHDIVAAGTYWWWFEAWDTSSTINSTPAGPITATVT